MNLPRIIALIAACHVGLAMALSAPFMGVQVRGYAILMLGLSALISVPRSPFDLAVVLASLASVQALIAVGIYSGGRFGRVSFWLSVGGLFSAIWIAVSPDEVAPSTMTLVWIAGLALAAIGQSLTFAAHANGHVSA